MTLTCVLDKNLSPSKNVYLFCKRPSHGPKKVVRDAKKGKTLFAHGHTSMEVEIFSENEICFKVILF
jgi:hypothetical protein